MKTWWTLGLVIAMAGCTSVEDDWMPEVASGGGKEDAVTTVAGSTIPSAYVDPTKAYLADRMIDSLIEVGALRGVAAELAQRVDGIVANLPPDGALHVAELAKIETPELFASLFPAEQAALPALWRLLEAPTSSGALTGPSLSAFDVVDASTPPGPLQVPATLAITSLAGPAQSAARRVQLLYNNDGNAGTISVADIDNALANPGPFTPAELDQLRAVRAEFLLRATSNAVARVRVPAPGDTTEVRTLGPVELRTRTNVWYVEDRTWNTLSNGASWTYGLSGNREVTGHLGLPARSWLLLIDRATGAEHVLSAGPIATKIPAGAYVLEVWTDGRRDFVRNATLPAVETATARVDLRPYVDYAFETPAGVPLVRNLNYTREPFGASRAYSTQHTFDLTTKTPTSQSATALALTGTPILGLPTGRYTIDVPGAGTLAFDIYPREVVNMSWNGTARRPDWHMVTPNKKAYGSSWRVGPASQQVFISATYIVADKQLVVRRGNQILLNKRLTAQMRDP